MTLCVNVTCRRFSATPSRPGSPWQRTVGAPQRISGGMYMSSATICYTRTVVLAGFFSCLFLPACGDQKTQRAFPRIRSVRIPGVSAGIPKPGSELRQGTYWQFNDLPIDGMTTATGFKVRKITFGLSGAADAAGRHPIVSLELAIPPSRGLQRRGYATVRGDLDRVLILYGEPNESVAFQINRLGATVPTLAGCKSAPALGLRWVELSE